MQLFPAHACQYIKTLVMPTKPHILVLNEQEAFMLYKTCMEARQVKQEKFDETSTPEVLEEIRQLRKLADRVFKLMVSDTTSPSRN